MARIFSADEIAAEAGIAQDRLDWLVFIGIVRPQEPGVFRFGDVFRAKLLSALLDAGMPEPVLERAVAEGWLNLDHLDGYMPFEPGPRSGRTFADFEASFEPAGSVLPAVYEVLGLPRPDPDSPIHVQEEAIFERFLEGWRLSNDDDTVLRAARLFGEGTRVATIGWAELLAEKIGRPAQERFLKGEIDRFPPEVMLAVGTLVGLAPEMFAWLSQRYVEQQFTANIVDGIERFLAARDLAPMPKAERPPAIVFVDLSGFTRLTEERGDEAAVRTAASLQREAETVATRRDSGAAWVPVRPRRGPHRPRGRAGPGCLRWDRQPRLPHRRRCGGRGGSDEQGRGGHGQPSSSKLRTSAASLRASSSR